jgi:hypothetical protein
MDSVVGRRFAGVLAVAVAVAFMAIGGVAQAAIVHPYLGSFGPDGSPGTNFGRPGAVAVDSADGDVYVADTAAGAIYKFGPAGEPVDFAALGTNKLEGLTLSNAEPGLVEMAVNPVTHDLYVVENAPVNGVSVFDADGEPAEFSELGAHTLTGFTELCGVALDSEGDVYAADYEGGVSVFEPSGTMMATVPTNHVCSVAVGPGGALYTGEYQAGVSRWAPSSFPVTPTTTWGPSTMIDPAPVLAVAADPANGDVYADEGNAIAQYDAGGTLLGKTGGSGEGALSGSEGVGVGLDGGLFAGAPGIASGGAGLVARYGPGEVEQPRVEATWASEVGSGEATLNAEVDPVGIAATYHFEYGSEPCGAGRCASSPEMPLGSGTTAIWVSRSIGGLTPATIYSFRVVVTTGAGTRRGPERNFRSRPANSTSGTELPDGRAYELVSAGRDNGAELGVPGPTSGLVNGGPVPQPAAADGDAFAFPSFTAFGDAVAAPNASYYLSRRAASGGWSTTNITPPDESANSLGPIRAFSPDLGTTAIVANSVLASGAVPGYPNLYLRDNATGISRALTTSAPAGTAPKEFCVNYIGASGDGRRVIFTASGALTPEAPVPPASNEPDLYEWTEAGGIRLVSVQPDGTPAPAASGLGFGPGADGCLVALSEIIRHPISADGRRIFWSETVPSRAIYARLDGTRTNQIDDVQGGAGPSGDGIFLTASADGSRVFFTDPNELVPGAGGGPNGDLYEYRVAEERLVDLTLPSGAEPSGVLGLLGASEDGGDVYFAATGALEPGAVPGAANLYLEHEGSLSLVAVLSRSEDDLDWNARKEQTASVTPDGHHLAFVSVETLGGYDNRLAGGDACRLGGAGEPQGSRGCDEVYLYDAATGRLDCASCNPIGSNPVGPIKPKNGIKPSRLNTVPEWTTPFEQPRYLSADGSRLFFLSEEALLPADTNGVQDLYEFERRGTADGNDCSVGSPSYLVSSAGCLFLISRGRSSANSYLLDASADGGDVFFSTSQALTPDDEDRGYDIYDARVGGVSPATASPAAACLSEGCRSNSAWSSPAQGTIGTAGDAGGNKQPRPCPKGKVRRHHRCEGKRRHRRHHRSRHRKRTTKAPVHTKTQGGAR